MTSSTFYPQDCFGTVFHLPRDYYPNADGDIVEIPPGYRYDLTTEELVIQKGSQSYDFEEQPTPIPSAYDEQAESDHYHPPQFQSAYDKKTENTRKVMKAQLRRAQKKATKAMRASAKVRREDTMPRRRRKSPKSPTWTLKELMADV